MPIDYRPPDAVPLRPSAQPVDTFTGAPQPVQDNRLMDLAKGLSTLDSGLRDFVDARREKQAQEDVLKGQQAFYENNQAGFEDAVRAGKIPAFASPTFVAAYKKAQGNVAGFDLQAKFSAAYDAWPEKTSNDPEAFKRFSQDFMKQNLGANTDPEILKGLLPHVNSLMTSGLERWVRDRHAATYGGAVVTLGAEVNQGVDGSKAVALQSGKPQDYSGLFAGFLGMRERAVKSGMKPMDADKMLVDTITAKAIEDRDPNLLKFLDQKVPGMGDATFAQTPHGQKQKQEAIDKLEVLGRRSIADAHTEQARQDEKAKKAVTAGIIDFIAKNPGQAVPEDLLVLGSKYDPDIRVNVVNWTKTLREPTAGDPQQILQLHRDIMGGRPNAIPEALDHGIIRNPQDLDKAYQLEKSVAEAGDRVTAVTKSEAAERVKKAIATQTTNDQTRALVTSGVLGLTPDGLAATADFERMLLEWTVKNPNASKLEQLDFTQKAGEMILKRLTPSDAGSMGSATYKAPTPEASAGTNTKAPEAGVPGAEAIPGAPTAGPTATEPAVPGSPALPPPAAPGKGASASPPTQGDQLQAAKDWATQNLSPTQRMLLERDAADKGQSLDAKLLEVYQGYVAKTGTRGSSTAPTPEAPAGAGGDTPAVPTKFDVAAGDSIAVQQVHHGVGGSEGKMGTPSPGTTAVVGDSPTKVLARLQTVPDEQFRGKAVFLSSGTSNNPQEAGYVRDQIALLKQKGATAVAVPGVGPGVKNQAAVNASLRSAVQEAGGTFFEPNIKWQRDGIHPAEVDKLREQGLQALASAAPIERIATSANPDAVGMRLEADILTAIQRFKAAPTRLAREGALFASARLRNDPVAANVLDLAATPESAGNYNAVIGNSRSTEDLSKLSIGEIFQLQHRLVARGMPSGAVGRYQFINGTLRGLVSELGISTSEKFTPELQDRLGLALLARRGYNEWRSGKLGDAAFARNLSQEWAGLPNPDTGQSFYPGQHAGVSLGHVMASLRGFAGAALNLVPREKR